MHAVHLMHGRCNSWSEASFHGEAFSWPSGHFMPKAFHSKSGLQVALLRKCRMQNCGTVLSKNKISSRWSGTVSLCEGGGRPQGWHMESVCLSSPDGHRHRSADGVGWSEVRMAQWSKFIGAPSRNEFWEPQEDSYFCHGRQKYAKRSQRWKSERG